MWKLEWLSVTVVVVVVLVGDGRSTPLSNQQLLRRRGIARGRSGSVTLPVSAEPEVIETTEPILVEYTGTKSHLVEREKQLQTYEKAMKTRESELETIKAAFLEREKVLEEREFALDVRDAELDQRSNNIDKQVLETDKRLKEREDRISAREKALSERESEILKLAEAREQEMERLSRERENAAQLREKALEDRELAVAERERKVEEREIRVQKRMENNRKRFQRRMELRQLEQRVGVVGSASTPRGRSLDFSSIDPVTQATTNHPRRVIEKVTFRKVTSSPTVSESTIFITDDGRGGVTTALNPDEDAQVTEAVAYESAKEYSTLASTSQKGETALVTLPASDVNSVGVTSSGKKRKSGKRRARQRRQHHHKNHKIQDEETAASTTTTSTSSRRSRTRSSHKTEADVHPETHKPEKKQRKVRKVVKKMGSDGTMVIIKHDH